MRKRRKGPENAALCAWDTVQITWIAPTPVLNRWTLMDETAGY